MLSHTGITDNSYVLPGKLVVLIGESKSRVMPDSSELSCELEYKVFTSSELFGAEPISPVALAVGRAQANTHSITLSTSSLLMVNADGSQSAWSAKRSAPGKSPNRAYVGWRWIGFQ